MIKLIRDLGISSDIAFGASFASILLSILMWNIRRGADAAHAERLGIFVGLWAPTLAILGHALQQAESERSLFPSVN